MELKNIQIIPVNPQNGLVAFASCEYAGLSFSGMSIHTNLKNQSYRLQFPTKSLKNGAQLSIFNPINTNVYECFRKAIVDKYLNLVGEEEGNKVFYG